MNEDHHVRNGSAAPHSHDKRTNRAPEKIVQKDVMKYRTVVGNVIYRKSCKQTIMRREEMGKGGGIAGSKR